MALVTTNQLSIYLQDHYAGAAFGSELARRAADQNAGSGFGDFLEELAREIDEDRAALRQIMQRYGVGPDRLKVGAAWASEKAGRLKLNGRLVGYAPLSRVLELEGLLAGVRGKVALWNSLREIAPDGGRLDAEELGRLITRGEGQLEGLARQHRAAARAAFA